MPDHPHLILPRAEYNLSRKKTGFGRAPDREYSTHGGALRTQLGEVLDDHAHRERPSGIDPNLILRIQLNEKAGVDEEPWERCGLILLSADENKTLVLFSSDSEMADFTRRLDEYRGGPPPEQKGPPHQQIFAAIDEISRIGPADRIGRLLRADGITEPAMISDAAELVIDIELWDLGNGDLNRQKIHELRKFIVDNRGSVTDHYVGESLVLLRARCAGSLVKTLLEIDHVAILDLPPAPTLTVGELLSVGVEDLPAVPEPDPNAPGVAILDSGISSGHPLLAPAVGEATTVPRSWDDAADVHGHGTMVAGLALYGDVEECIRTRSFQPRLRLYSARVLNSDLRFDDERLITTQMRQAIEYFRETYGCRVFNASLGDPRLPYRGGKVSPWASILDTLARELDVVIIVSAGNSRYEPGDGDTNDTHVQEYPRYLLDDAARIIEPATGAIVVTVGSLAHRSNTGPGTENYVTYRPVASIDEPSPFTRCGPGLGGSIKPEFCEYGGNAVYDGTTQRIRGLRELSVISLRREYIKGLFTTDHGTSFAAPRVAHVAASLFESLPNASANLIRALLANSARVPEPAENILQPHGAEAVLRVCGYGRPDLRQASLSDDARVVLYAEATLEHDKFHIFELPIPDELIEEAGTRRIAISLAYDPPVRHTRFDYLGVKMSFRLIRGKSVQEIAEAFRQRTKDEDAVDRLTSTKHDCSMEPKVTLRENSTLQRATFTMKRKPAADYGDTYYVVVRCERKWARVEHSPQRYAVVVSVEHSAEVDLYSKIRNRIREAARVRARQRARG